MRALLLVGRIDMDLGDLSAARSFERAVVLAAQLGDASLRAEALALMAASAVSTGPVGDSVLFARQADALLDATDAAPRDELALRRSLASVLTTVGALDEAGQQLDAAHAALDRATLPRATRDRERVLTLLQTLQLHHAAFDYMAASRDLQRAMALLEQLDEPPAPFIGELHEAAAVIAETLGDDAEARRHREASATTYEQLGGPVNEVLGLRQRAHLASDPHEAIALLRRAADRARRSALTGYMMPLISYDLGLALEPVDAASAEIEILRALDESERMYGEGPQLVRPLHGLVMFYSENGRSEELAPLAERMVRATARMRPDAPMAVFARWILSLSLLIAGEYDAGCALARPLGPHLGVLGVPGSDDEYQLAMARCDVAQGVDVEAALERGRRAYRALQDVYGDDEYLAQVRTWLEESERALAD